jgi:hypothetical protein
MGFGPRIRRGERHHAAKLTRPLIQEAKRLWEEDWTLKQIHARLELDCSLSTLYKAIKGYTYRDEGS